MSLLEDIVSGDGLSSMHGIIWIGVGDLGWALGPQMVPFSTFLLKLNNLKLKNWQLYGPMSWLI